MDPVSIGGYIAAVVGAVLTWLSTRGSAWRDEAEAQKSRADRLERELESLSGRVDRLETENRRLAELASGTAAIEALSLQMAANHIEILQAIRSD